MAGESPALNVRAACRSLDWLASRGEVRIERGLAVYTPQPETRGRKGTAHKRLWRAAHRCSQRAGGFTRRELMQLARVTPFSATGWVGQMKRAGRLTIGGQEGRAPVYRLAAGQPGPEQPPAFRWPRRGKAKTSRDIMNQTKTNP